MKKLMIALAAVAFAAGVQAASLNWSQNTATLTPGGDGFVANGLNVYLIQTSAHDQNAFISALASAASVDAFASTVAGWAAADPTVTGDAMGTFLVSGGSSTAFTAGAAEYAYYAVIDSANKMVYMSMSEKTSYDGVKPDGGEYTFAFSEDSAYASANGPFKAKDGNVGAGWYNTAAVPEPTSGLLLLLGVAGLALRRRRA